MKFSVFIPTLNEKDNIFNLINKLLEYPELENIIVVDDSSSDGTIETVKKLKQKYANIYLVVRKDDFGRGASGVLGFKEYLKLNDKSDFLVEMDADGSHDPEYIKQFMVEINNGYNVVIGSRYIEGGKESGRNFIRPILSKLAHLIIKTTLNIHLKDITSGYRAYKKEILQQINFDNFIAVGPEIVEEMYFVLHLMNENIKEIPIIFNDRNLGESKLTLQKTFKVFLSLFRIKFNDKNSYLKDYEKKI